MVLRGKGKKRVKGVKGGKEGKRGRRGKEADWMKKPALPPKKERNPHLGTVRWW